jgi:ABC-type antimicrobial peptide transport system permease subunit
VIVNRTFAQRITGNGSSLGHRVRYIRTVAGPAVASEPWYEIIGVVDDLPANTGTPRMYHPMARGEVHPVSLALRVRPGSPNVASRFRETTAALAPALRLEAVAPLDEVYRQRWRSRYLAGVMVGAVALSVLLLSAAGMYALMSFIVNQRRREIGIRSALGASRNRLLAGIFKRTLAQLAAGATLGVLAAYLLGAYLPIEEAGGRDLPGVLPAAATLMMVVGLLAAAGPARRALRIEPAEAVREG